MLSNVPKICFFVSPSEHNFLPTTLNQRSMNIHDKKVFPRKIKVYNAARKWLFPLLIMASQSYLFLLLIVFTSPVREEHVCFVIAN